MTEGRNIGIDFLEVDRMERALARRPALGLRLFTDGERAYAETRARPTMHLAARFCAKEAVAKALALEVWSPRDVEVTGGGDEVRLSGRARERADVLGVGVEVSLTHTRALAGAVAVTAP